MCSFSLASAGGAAVVLLAVFPFLANAIPMPVPGASDLIVTGNDGAMTSMQPGSQCGFIGRQNTYGIGIRVGVYSFVVAAWMAHYIFDRQARAIYNHATIFSIAVLVMAVLFIVHAAETHAVEAFIIFAMLSWSSAAGTQLQRQPTYDGSTGRLVLINTVRAASLALSLWFWFTGIESFDTGSCETKVFFFAEVSMFGWFRQMMKVISALAVAKFAYNLCWIAIRVWSHENFKTEDLKKAVEMFEHSQELRKDLQRELASPSATRSGTLTADEWNSSEDGRGRSNSDTWRTFSTLASEETTTQKAERIRVQTQEYRISHFGLTVPDKDPARHFHSPLFEAIYNGEVFLNHCLAAPSADNKTPCYFLCMCAYLKDLITFRFSRNVAILLQHLSASQKLSILSIPYQLYSALHYTGTLASSRFFAIASQVDAFRNKDTKKPFNLVPALVDIAIHVFLIVQIELTIAFNGVGGLNTIGSLGQLVPLLVGIASLALIITSGIDDLRARSQRDSEAVWLRSNTENMIWEGRFLAAYDEWKFKTGRTGEDSILKLEIEAAEKCCIFIDNL